MSLRNLLQCISVYIYSVYPKAKGKISEKQLKYFTYKYKKTTNLGKLYLLSKIHKRLSDVPGRSVISNCGTPTEKVSEFLDYQLKPIMQKGKSYIKDSGDFINKISSTFIIPPHTQITPKSPLSIVKH